MKLFKAEADSDKRNEVEHTNKKQEIRCVLRDDNDSN